MYESMTPSGFLNLAVVF